MTRMQIVPRHDAHPVTPAAPRPDGALGQLEKLSRPRLLIRAARFGLADYRREPALRRLLKTAVVPGPAEALERLLGLEATLEAARRSGAAGYAVARHVEVLIALMGEARLLRAAGRHD